MKCVIRSNSENHVVKSFLNVVTQYKLQILTVSLSFFILLAVCLLGFLADEIGKSGGQLLVNRAGASANITPVDVAHGD